MKKSVYITTVEPNSGKSVITLGLMNELLAKIGNVGYFRPIVNQEEDNHVQTVLNFFKLSQTTKESYALTRAEVIKYLNEGNEQKIFDKIIRKHKKLQKKYDFILVEGSDFAGEGVILEFGLNVKIAVNLNTPTILVGNADNKKITDFISGIQLAYDSFKEKNVQVVALIANKVPSKYLKTIVERLRKKVDEEVYITAIAKDETLANPGIRDIIKAMDAEILLGEHALDKEIKRIAVGAMQIRHFLKYIKDKTLVITPGDRADIILASLQVDRSYNYPGISGIVLSGGLKPEKSIMKLLEGINTNVPILSVKPQTYDAATQIESIKVQINPDDKTKIYRSIRLFNKYVDSKALLKKISDFDAEDRMTPGVFLYMLEERASKNKKRIVLPEAIDPRILKAAAKIVEKDLADIILLGKEKTIKAIAKENNIDLDWDKVTIIDPETSPLKDKYAKKLYELRKHKGVNLAMAYDLVEDGAYFGTMMVREGDADGMVSGAIHTTAHTIRPALQVIKTKPGSNFVSSTFFMAMPDRVSAFADCAIVPNPNAEQLAEIAIMTADAAKQFGLKPKVAMLSYSSGTSGSGEDVEKVRKATEIVKKKRPDILIEGPIQYDAAVDPKVGKKKLPGSPVAGEANVLIFPDLNTGNNTYKAIQRETGALAIGPMSLGLRKPVNDLSRGATVDDIYNTILLTSIQAQETEKEGKAPEKSDSNHKTESKKAVKLDKS